MTDQDQLNQLTAEVLAKGYLASFGIHDAQGVWVADVIYVHDNDFNLYWMSKLDRRHSKSIETNPNIAAAITVTTGPGESDMGLQMFGEAQRVSEIPFQLVCKYFRKRDKPEPSPGDDVLGEHVWYRLTPSRIELIHERTFGHDRQKVR